METNNSGWTGRADYEERRQERIDRLHDRAEREAGAAHTEYTKAHDLVKDIPFGQPNIIGRPALPNLRKKSAAAMDRGIEHDRKADYYAHRAEAAESNAAISSDDPAALEKLRDKLAKMEELQAHMKAVNAAIRMKDTAKGDAKLAGMGYTPRKIQKLREPDFCGRVGFPSYALTNNNANMKRVRDRIAELERRASAPAPEGWTFDGGEVCVNVEENRLQIFFDSIPDEDTRAELKSNGFRWARSVGAWQRQLTDNALHAAKRIRALSPAGTV